MSAIEVIAEALSAEVQGEPITEVYRPEGLAIVVYNALVAAGLLADEKRFKALIERSSLGTPGAKALRARTPQGVVDEIMRRVDATRAAAGTDSADPPERDLSPGAGPRNRIR